jgi:hypothetical protein
LFGAADALTSIPGLECAHFCRIASAVPWINARATEAATAAATAGATAAATAGATEGATAAATAGATEGATEAVVINGFLCVSGVDASQTVSSATYLVMSMDT